MADIPINIANWVGRTPMVQLTRLLPDAPADLQDGDKVLVQARLPRRDPGAAPFAARKLVDQTRKHDESDDETEGDEKPESSDD